MTPGIPPKVIIKENVPSITALPTAVSSPLLYASIPSIAIILVESIPKPRPPHLNHLATTNASALLSKLNSFAVIIVPSEALFA